MIKKFFQFCCLLVFLFAVIYLLLPAPLEPPLLPDSRRSTEPGDTTEIPGLFAYYTNLSRPEIIAFYQESFSRSSFWGIPLLTYRLNHPPEYTWVVIRDTIHSSYIEEVVHPFRESLYLSGYEPAKDPFKKDGKLADFEFEGKSYTTKITVLRKDSNPVIRLAIFVAVIFCLVLVSGQVRKTYEDIRHHR